QSASGTRCVRSKRAMLLAADMRQVKACWDRLTTFRKLHVTASVLIQVPAQSGMDPNAGPRHGSYCAGNFRSRRVNLRVPDRRSPSFAHALCFGAAESAFLA